MNTGSGATAPRSIFVMVDSRQYCYVSHSVQPGRIVRALLKRDRRWIAYAIVETVLGSFSDAAERARMWRAVASLNAYETVRQPRVLEYVQTEAIFGAAIEKAFAWPFRVNSWALKKRRLSFHEERNLARSRHIYVIANRAAECYIGQSVNPKSRIASHYSGAAGEPTAQWLASSKETKALVLDTVHGTYWDAVKAEFKWRRIAELNGYRNVDIIGSLVVLDSVESEAQADAGLWPFNDC